MRYYKLNGQPALDSEFDGGSPPAPVQGGAGGAPVDQPSMSSVFGSSTPADFPDFEEIIGRSPGPDAAASAADSTATTSGATSTATQSLTSAGSGLVFNNSFGSGATQAFINEVDAAETYLQSLFGNSCTVNCSFDVQSLNPQFSGENSFDPVTVSYSMFVNALKSHASTPTAVAAANSLAKLSDPTGGKGVEVSVGEAQILGLASPDGVTDDSVILNSVYWTPSALQNNPGDAEAVIEHELSEGIMGRIGSLGIADSAWAPMDFFRYTASGQRDFTGGQDGRPTYFSVDGTNVNTGLQFHNSVSPSGKFDGFDFADWDGVGADSNDHDPFGPGGPGNGDPGTLSATDIQIMQALGWSPPAPSLGKVVAVGDFNDDAHSDLAYYNAANGVTQVQLLNGTSAISTGEITNSPFENNPSWTVVGVGDFNDDGHSDLVYYDAAAGVTEVMFMNGATATGGGVIANSPFEFNTAWTVVGVGDFNHDGHSDLVYYDAATGVTEVQLINGTTASASSLIANSPFENNRSWTVVGVGDFNDDGHSDLVYYDAAAGVTEVMFMNGATATGGGVIANSPFEFNTAWNVVGVGDFNGDGHADLVYYDAATGVTEVQLINGTTASASSPITNSPFENNPSWTVVGVGDFNDDGHSDLVYYNAAADVTEVMLMNSTTATGGGVIATNSAGQAVGSSDIEQMTNEFTLPTSELDQSWGSPVDNWAGLYGGNFGQQADPSPSSMTAPSQPWDSAMNGLAGAGWLSYSPSMDTTADLLVGGASAANNPSLQLDLALSPHHA